MHAGAGTSHHRCKGGICAPSHLHSEHSLPVQVRREWQLDQPHGIRCRLLCSASCQQCSVHRTDIHGPRIHPCRERTQAAGTTSQLTASSELLSHEMRLSTMHVFLASTNTVQGQTHDVLKAQQSGDGEGIHMTGISTARSTSPGSAAAPGFDFEGLLHGAARLPSTNSLAPDASSKGIEPAQTVIEHGRAAALHRASAHAEWTEPDHDSSVSTLRSLEVWTCALILYDGVWHHVLHVISYQHGR